MSKNNYYYKKLAQSIIFGELSWQEIVDLDDPHDNVYSEEFLTSLYHLLLSYQRKACLEREDIKKLQTLLSDLRFTYPYQSRTEKIEIYSMINEMIRMSNEISDSGIGTFYMEEYKKRYGVYAPTNFGKDLLAKYVAYYLDGEPRGIKKDLSQDIYPLTLFYYGIEDLTEEHMHNFSMSDCFFSTINALLAEQKEILNDTIIRGRFLTILRKNRELLNRKECESSGNEKDDKMFERHNQFILKRLERMETRK